MTAPTHAALAQMRRETINACVMRVMSLAPSGCACGPGETTCTRCAVLAEAVEAIREMGGGA
jgi:hypothetical protein